MMAILLFDIDGTLLMSGGAGRRSMNQAFEDLFGIPCALEGLTLSGMTDPKIFRNACQKAGVKFSDSAHEKFKNLYLRYLREEIEKAHPGKKLLPGVPELLKALSENPTIYLGLLTGNYQEGAQVKLGHFGLDRYFKFGAFGDDDENRDRLLPHALERFARAYGRLPNGEVVWVIGDTPKDVACARPYRAKALAVATGEYNEHQLAKAQPDALMKDLREIRKFMRVIQN